MRALNLLYHRVNTLQPDPWTLCVSPRHFDEQLQVIKSLNPRPMVTFDDGYRDNLEQALPLLEKYDVSARIFLISGFLDSRQEMWWDVLARLYLTGEPPFDWDAADTTDGQRQYREWFVRLRSARHEAQQKLLAQLVPVRSAADEVAAEKGRLLTREEGRRLAASPLIEIGAHTVTHPVLSGLNALQQQQEIAGSRAELEETLGRPVLGFAYPNGTDADYSALTVELVRQAGFAYAYSAFEHDRTDLFQMPRVMIRDWDGDEFSRELRDGEIRMSSSFQRKTESLSTLSE